tara:strand:- start:1537 stop:2679 length:1143 start_codon:yes stop_codon:yes gene_type:complete
MVNSIGPAFKGIGEIAKKMWADLKAWVNDKFIQPIRDSLDDMKEWWGGFKESVMEKWDALSAYIGEKLSVLWDMLPSLPELFTLDFWTGLFVSIGSTVAGWASSLWDMLPDMPDVFSLDFWVGLFGSIASTVSGWSTSLWDMLPNMPDFFSLSFWTGLFGSISSTVGGWAVSLWDMLPDMPDFFSLSFWTGLFTSVGTTVGGWASSLWDMLPDMPDFFSLSFWTGLLDGIKDTFKSTFTVIGTFMADLLKAPINALIGAINSVFEGINFSQTIWNPLGDDWEVGMDLSSWSITPLAKGGIVNKPTLSLIGEDGPEAVIPLTQRNNPGGVGAGGGGTYNITVNAGGITDRTDKRALAREIGNMIQQELSRNMGGTTMRGRY